VALYFSYFLINDLEVELLEVGLLAIVTLCPLSSTP